jgi:hypothetical protein
LSTIDLRDRIAARAYEIWEKAGRPQGQHEQHWLEAERQIEDEGWQRDPKLVVKQQREVAATTSELHLDRPPAAPRAAARRPR